MLHGKFCFYLREGTFKAVKEKKIDNVANHYELANVYKCKIKFYKTLDKQIKKP